MHCLCSSFVKLRSIPNLQSVLSKFATCPLESSKARPAAAPQCSLKARLGIRHRLQLLPICLVQTVTERYHRMTSATGATMAGAAGRAGSISALRTACAIVSAFRRAGPSALQAQRDGLLPKRCGCTTGGNGVPLGSNSEGSAPIAHGRQSAARTHLSACLRAGCDNCSLPRPQLQLVGEHHGRGTAPASCAGRCVCTSPLGNTPLQKHL